MAIQYTSYSLLIRGTRTMHANFDDRASLATEIARHLTKSEISSGVLDRLIDFDHKKPGPEGYAQNSWQNFTVTAYPD